MPIIQIAQLEALFRRIGQGGGSVFDLWAALEDDTHELRGDLPPMDLDKVIAERREVPFVPPARFRFQFPGTDSSGRDSSPARVLPDAHENRQPQGQRIRRPVLEQERGSGLLQEDREGADNDEELTSSQPFRDIESAFGRYEARGAQTRRLKNFLSSLRDPDSQDPVTLYDDEEDNICWQDEYDKEPQP